MNACHNIYETYASIISEVDFFRQIITSIQIYVA